METFLPKSMSLLARRIEPAKVTKLGISVVNAESAPVQKAEVIAIGRLVIDYSVGDVILYHKFSGLDLKINDESLLLINESDVYGVIKEQDD